MSTAGDDRSISIDRDVIGSTVITGNGNIVVLQAAGMVRDDEPQEQSADAKIGPNPYKGLLAFHEEDADRFFGREEQIGRLWQLFRNLHDPPPHGQSPLRLLPVLGPSGSGKSSVARAGLIPELARRPMPDWNKARVAVLTPGSHPLEALGAVLARIATGDTAPVRKTREFVDELKIRSEHGQCDGLRRIAASLPEIASTPLIVLVDQFEEVYSLCTDKDERKTFVDNLLCAVSDPAANASAIITLRTDFLDETQKHPLLNSAIASHGAIIPAMNEDELRRAITEPAKLAGRPLDEATVDLLINETKGRDGALPLLQFALTRIWDGLIDGVEPSNTLKKIGGVGGALAGEAQRIYENLPEVEKHIARRVFMGLVQLGEGTRDTRRRVIVASLVAVGEDEDQVEEVVRRFSAPGVRLITLSSDKKGQADTAEITHEALFEHWRQLDEWLANSRDDLRFQRRLDQAARHWGIGDRAEGLLWRPPDLDLLRSFQERSMLDMTPIQMEFYTACEQAETDRILAKTRQEQRLRHYLYTAITAAAVAAVFGVIAFSMFLRARVERTNALVQKEAAEKQERTAQRLAEEKSELAAVERDLRKAAEWKTAEMVFEQSYAKCVQQGPGEGVLWLSDSLKTATDLGHVDLIRRIRMQIAAWTDSIHSLRLVIEIGSSVDLLAISPDGKLIAIGSDDKTVRMWHVSGQTFVGEPLQCDASVTALAFSPDNKTLLTGSQAGKIKVWQTDTGKAIGKEFDVGSPVRCIAFSPDGQTTIAGGEFGSATLWELETRNQIGKPFECDEAVNAAAFSSDGRLLLTGTRNGTCELWDINKQVRVKEIASAPAEIWSVAFSSDNKTVLVGSGDGRVARRFLPTPSVSYAPAIRNAEVANSNRLGDFQLLIQRYISTKPNPTQYVAVLQDEGLPISRQGIMSMAVSPDESTYLVGRRDGRVNIQNTSSGKGVGASMLHQDQVNAVVFTPDGTACVTGSNDGTVRIWDVQTSQLNGIPLQHGGVIRSIAISLDNKTIATASDKTIQLWSVEKHNRIGSPLVHESPVYAVAFSPNSKQVVSGCDDGVARFWDIATGAVVRPDLIHKDSVNEVAFSPDGSILLTGCDDRHAHLWDIATGSEMANKLDHKDEVFAVAFSPNGKIIATGSKDHTVKLWGFESGTTLIPPLIHSDKVFSVGFDVKGDVLVTGCADGSARLWDVQTGKLMGRPLPHKGDVRDARFSPDGNYVVTASTDETMQIWDVSTGKAVGEPFSHDQGVGAVAISGDSQWLLSGCADGTARLRRFPAPVTESVQRVKLRAEVITGLTLGDDQSVRHLDSKSWNQRTTDLPKR